MRGTEAGMEAGQLEAEAQDVCHQLLESPFRECHAQVWVGVGVVTTTREAGSRRCYRGAKQGIWSWHCFVCMYDLRAPF